MRPLPATSSRPGLVGGAASLALHAGVIGAVILGIGGGAPPIPEETMVVEIALAPAPVPAPAPAAVSAEPPHPRPSPPASRASAAPVGRVTASRPAATPAPVPASNAETGRDAADTAGGEPGQAETATGHAGAPGQAETATGHAGAPGQAEESHGAAGDAHRSAEAIDAPPPPYPLAARRRGLEGRVVLRLGLDAEGRVDDVRVERSSGSETLDGAAVEAARGWRFRPARRGGRAVAASLLVPIRFQLGGIVVARAEGGGKACCALASSPR